MAYLVDEAKAPSTFVTEAIPQEVLDSFDPRRLYRPIGGDQWPDNEWTVDKARNVAWIGGGTNGNAAADEGVPPNIWCTLLVEGLPVGVVYKSDLETVPGIDSKTGRVFEIIRMHAAHLYLPAELYGRKDEVIALVEEAEYASRYGPKRGWLRGAVLEVNASYLDTDYRSLRHAI